MWPPKIVRSTPDAICCRGLLVPAFDTTSTLPVASSVIASALALASTYSIVIPSSFRYPFSSAIVRSTLPLVPQFHFTTLCSGAFPPEAFSSDAACSGVFSQVFLLMRPHFPRPPLTRFGLLMSPLFFAGIVLCRAGAGRQTDCHSRCQKHCKNSLFHDFFPFCYRIFMVIGPDSRSAPYPSSIQCGLPHPC